MLCLILYVCNVSKEILCYSTVWYELLCGEWPFKGQPPEAIIWQVGKGMKQTLANLQASRDVKVYKNHILLIIFIHCYLCLSKNCCNICMRS